MHLLITVNQKLLGDYFISWIIRYCMAFEVSWNLCKCNLHSCLRAVRLWLFLTSIMKMVYSILFLHYKFCSPFPSNYLLSFVTGWFITYRLSFGIFRTLYDLTDFASKSRSRYPPKLYSIPFHQNYSISPPTPVTENVSISEWYMYRPKVSGVFLGVGGGDFQRAVES